MQEKDIAAKEFFNRPVIVADLCNSVIFGGEKVVEPEGVAPLGTEMTAGPLEDSGEGGAGTSVRRRDSCFRISHKMPNRAGLEEFDFHSLGGLRGKGQRAERDGGLPEAGRRRQAPAVGDGQPHGAPLEISRLSPGAFPGNGPASSGAHELPDECVRPLHAG